MTSQRTFPGQTSETADTWKLLQALFAHRWLILGITAAVVLGVGLWTLRQQKIYEGVVTLEYDPNPPRPLGSEIEDVSSPAINFWQTQEWYETQNRIIASRSVARRVVEELGLHENAAFMQVPKSERKAWKGATVKEAARMLLNKLSVNQVQDTRLVEVRVEDPSPKRAAVLANAVADAYIEKTIEDRMGSTLNALNWLSKQLDTRKRELQDTENALHQFKRDHDVLSLSLEDKQNIVAQDLERYSAALTEAKQRRIALGARLAQLQAAYDDDPLKVNLAAFTEHPVIAELRDAYRTKQAERKALGVKYGESHPAMQALTEELETLKSQMQSEINGLIHSAEAQLREVQQTEAGLQTAAKQTHEEGLQLNQKEIEYNSLKRQQENQSKLYSILLERTTETDLTRMLHVTNVRVLDRALPPEQALKPRLILNLILALLIGLMLGTAVAFVLVHSDRSIRSVEDLEALGVTVLGIVPEMQQSAGLRLIGGRAKAERREAAQSRDLIVHEQPMSAVAECCRTIRTNLTFMGADKPFQALVVTSAGPLEGKTTVAISLATALAQTGKRVLLVDTDLRRPRIHRAFSLSSAVGLTSVLVEEFTLEQAAQKTPVPGLEVLPSGPIPPNPSELLSSSAFGDFLRGARAAYDRVVFDSPPLGAVTDGAVLAPQVDGTVLIVRANKTSRDGARLALRRLQDVEARVVGAVLNGVPLGNRRYNYGGYYSDEYRASQAPDDASDSAA